MENFYPTFITRITFYLLMPLFVMVFMSYPARADTDKIRIVSLTPHITNILFDIGAGENVVGTPFTYKNEHPDIPNIGGFMNPSVEKIVSLSPNLIIGSSASARPELINKLRNMGYRVEMVNEDSLVDIYRSIITIGMLTGKKENAKKIMSVMQIQIGELEYSIKDKPRKTVFYQVWETPLMTIGKESYIREILMKAHLRPITIDAEYGRISIEDVIKADPDVILIPYESTMNVDVNIFVKAWDKYPQMKAVKNHQVLIINSDNLHMPGSGLVNGLHDVIEVVWGIK